MQVVVIVVFWIGVGVLIWWARGAGVRIALNSALALLVGAIGLVLLFVGETGAVLLGLAGLGYGGYGAYVVYRDVKGVLEDRAEQ